MSDAIPTWQKLLVLPFLPFSIFGAGCSDGHPASTPHDVVDDKPRPFPGRPDAGESDSGVPDASELPCQPDPCEGGYIDPLRVTGDQAICLRFVETSTTVGLTDVSRHHGVSLVDLDGDGRRDVYVHNRRVPDLFFLNTQAGFISAAARFGLDAVGRSGSVDAAWGDYDRDGDVDLMLVGESGGHLYRQENGRFIELPADEGIHNSEPGRRALWLGADLLLGTANGLRFYRYLGGNRFAEVSREAGIDDPGDAARLAAFDFDRDGDLDVYVANSTGRNRFFRNRGDGTFESIEHETNTAGRGNSTDVHWLAFDGTQRALFVINYAFGNQFFVQQPDGMFEDSAGHLGLRDPGNTTATACADFVKEGRLACFLGRYEQQNLLYIPVPTTSTASIERYLDYAHPLGLDSIAKTVDAEAFDFNNDGAEDLLVISEEGGMKLYENQTHPIHVCP